MNMLAMKSAVSKASTLSRQLGFIGAGKMAEALAGGFMQSGICFGEQISATDRNSDRMNVFRQMGANAF